MKPKTEQFEEEMEKKITRLVTKKQEEELWES